MAGSLPVFPLVVLIPAGASILDLGATRDAIAAAKDARHGRKSDLPRVIPSVCERRGAST